MKPNALEEWALIFVVVGMVLWTGSWLRGCQVEDNRHSEVLARIRHDCSVPDGGAR